MSVCRFKDIPVGQFVLFNGHYAVKTHDKKIHVTKLGIDGYFELDDDTELELEDNDDVRKIQKLI